MKDRIENNKMFKVHCGSIYNSNSGCIIECMSVIIDKNASLLKYGNSEGVFDYYNHITSKYREIGLEDMANDLIYVEFDKYSGILTIEEICTFANYMVMCSANGQKLFNMLQMERSQLKAEIKKLSEMGY